MRISELIQFLQQTVQELGDINVAINDADTNARLDIRWARMQENENERCLLLAGNYDEFPPGFNFWDADWVKITLPEEDVV